LVPPQPIETKEKKNKRGRKKTILQMPEEFQNIEGTLN
jgi:hypothetical protein